jgi:hypothetical protein
MEQLMQSSEGQLAFRLHPTDSQNVYALQASLCAGPGKQGGLANAGLTEHEQRRALVIDSIKETGERGHLALTPK